MKRWLYFVLGIVMLILSYYLYEMIRIVSLPFSTIWDYAPLFPNEEVIFPIILSLPLFVGGITNIFKGFNKKTNEKFQKRSYIVFLISGVFFLLFWLTQGKLILILTILISLVSTFFSIKALFEK
ncbi:MAG: hypothetical protein KJ905_00385 [Nanoarchaeota archaeon]|nr:hypothetical protein [Nanoarchaeota archaeon]MBU1501217.1 hypothetical protein [Nanoarchaeota archaeon]MBU2459072.1 hypothetical protein [Nanoarchaeota archaeon]